MLIPVHNSILLAIRSRSPVVELAQDLAARLLFQACTRAQTLESSMMRIRLRHTPFLVLLSSLARLWWYMGLVMLVVESRGTEGKVMVNLDDFMISFVCIGSWSLGIASLLCTYFITTAHINETNESSSPSFTTMAVIMLLALFSLLPLGTPLLPSSKAFKGVQNPRTQCLNITLSTYKYNYYTHLSILSISTIINPPPSQTLVRPRPCELRYRSTLSGHLSQARGLTPCSHKCIAAGLFW
jgi:hypothetical protein